mgnify:CR=1 FL=1
MLLPLACTVLRAYVAPQFELNLTKKSKKKKKEKKEKKQDEAPAPEPAPVEDAKAAQEARLAKLASGPAPPVAEDGLALQDEKTVDVEQLNPLTPEVRRAALRLPLRRSIVWPRRRQAGLCSDCRPLSTR